MKTLVASIFALSLSAGLAHAQVEFRNSKLTVGCTTIERLKWGDAYSTENQAKRKACDELAESFQQKWFRLAQTQPVFADDTMIVTTESVQDPLYQRIRLEFSLRSDTHIITDRAPEIRSGDQRFYGDYRDDEEVKTNTVCSNANRVLASDPTVLRFSTAKGTSGGPFKPRTVCRVSELIRLEAVDLN